MGVTKSGKYYFECRIAGQEHGICRIGWSTLRDKLDLGTSSTGYGYGGTGKKVNGNVFSDYGAVYSAGDLIGCCLDLDAGTISFSKNGTDLGIAFSDVKSDLQYFPTLCLKGSRITVNFTSPFESVPPLYSSISSAPQIQPYSPNRSVLALILEPTRELAEQTFDCLNHFKSFMSHPSVSVVRIKRDWDCRD